MEKPIVTQRLGDKCGWQVEHWGVHALVCFRSHTETNAGFNFVSPFYLPIQCETPIAWDFEAHIWSESSLLLTSMYPLLLTSRYTLKVCLPGNSKFP